MSDYDMLRGVPAGTDGQLERGGREAHADSTGGSGRRLLDHDALELAAAQSAEDEHGSQSPFHSPRAVPYAASEPGTGEGTGYQVPNRVREEFASEAGTGSSPRAASLQNEDLSTASGQHETHEHRGRSGRSERRQRSSSVTELHPRHTHRPAPRTGMSKSTSKPNLRDSSTKAPKASAYPRPTPGGSRLKPAAEVNHARTKPPEVIATRFKPAEPLLEPHKLPGKPGFVKPSSRLNIAPRVVKGPKDLKEAVRRWYKFDKNGKMTIVNADKYELMQELGVHTRDLRILDPSLTSSYPSCILSREHALVVNLEFVQVIITTDTTLVLNAENDKVHPFVEELQRRLTLSSTMPLNDGPYDGERESQRAAMQALEADSTQDVPYELKVLESCLDTVANYMIGLVKDLEEAAYPALDLLTTRVNASNLERVRRVKNRMVRLNTRVETIRSVLEKYLDDDEDMEDLHLTGKQQVAKRELERARAKEQKRAADFARYEAKRTKQLDDDANASISSFSSSSGSSESEDKGWLSEEVEMLLEPYFMSFDNTWNRIQTLAEYIDDTEDLINITLDSHRNQLIQIDLLLTAATFCIGLVTTVAGLMGMNLNNGMEDSKLVFDLTSVLSSVLAVVCMVLFVLFLRWQRLMFT